MNKYRSTEDYFHRHDTLKLWAFGIFLGAGLYAIIFLGSLAQWIQTH